MKFCKILKYTEMSFNVYTQATKHHVLVFQYKQLSNDEFLGTITWNFKTLMQKLKFTGYALLFDGR